MQLLKTAEVAKLTGLHRNTIGRWARDGKFPPGKLIGHSRRWLRSDVEAWLAAQFATDAEANRA